MTYDGDLTSDALSKAVERHAAKHSTANDSKVIPINIDSREAAPASAREMAEIKRFLRANNGSRALVFWPTTDEEIASDMVSSYEAIAGKQPIELPLIVEGPLRDSWVDIAKNTVTLVNRVDSIELLANPADYDPAKYVSLGEFLRQISTDFRTRRVALLRSTKKPLKLTVLFACESAEPGVLSQLTSSARFGLLDASALVHVTQNSELGRWWASRRGLLTQAIVQLDAHAFVAPPALFIPILRSYAPEAVMNDLLSLGTSKKSPNELIAIMARSDVGRHLLGERRSAYETRGNPGENSRIAYSLLVSQGYIHNGKDKALNKAVAEGLHQLFTERSASMEMKAEKKLAFVDLIPDVIFEDEDIAHCLEFAWRSGDHLRATNRSDISTYILNKLRNYSRCMGWTDD
ncbi:hypothetical protein [Streptosporangium saharense]|uniref:hypothetical protein n=1 Tax=Streptosporangium saharense TaxID=1706840 RepID=UPI003687937D